MSLPAPESTSAAQPAAAADWNAAPLAKLTAHIVATHHEYLRRELPALAGRLARVAEIYREREPRTMAELPGVLQDLTDELMLHMRKEEMMLFPAIEACESAAAAGRPLPPMPFGPLENPVGMMEMEHDNAKAALALMRRLTQDNAIPSYACPTYTSLMNGLRELEADLHLHIHLENDILFPRAVRLEQEHDASVRAQAGR